MSQAMLFNTNPTGQNNAGQLDALMAEGGIQDCGNAQNCVAVCPKIPLTTSIARARAGPPRFVCSRSGLGRKFGIRRIGVSPVLAVL